MKTTSLRNWLPASLLTLLPLTATAHDFALVPKMSEGKLAAVEGRYGHPGAWEESETYRMIALDCHSAKKSISLIQKIMTPPAAIPQPVAAVPPNAGTTIVTATYDNGYWVSMEDESYFRTTKKMMAGTEGVANASHNIKFAKTVISSPEDDGFDTVTGQQLEIVPLSNPANQSVEDTFPVQILFNGSPLPKAKVTIVGLTETMTDSSPSAQSNEEGVAQLPISETGFLLIRLDHATKSAEPELADEDHFSSTLVVSLGS